MKTENKTLNIAGKKIQLTILGEGPPLLYLHSAGGETEPIDFHKKLAEKYTVYLPAHPGFALSEGLDQIDDIHDLAWHYVDLMQQLNLENVPVVSWSLGSWLAAEIKLIRPNLIGPLVMIAAAGLHVDGAPMAELFLDSFDELRELLFFDPNCQIAFDLTPSDVNDPRILLWLRAREATARVGWNPYLHDPKLAGHLHRLDSPIHIIWGRQDKLIPLAHGEYYVEHLPNAKLTILEECGHMVPYEKTEETAKLTLDFLASA
ncbi:alpha/beta hydrolase [Bremerella cremea]|uniref:alpha/beta fold hydrolase n=1 Tax=Bremerella cremea TaxID=1031537 RepID=UPI0031E61089